MKIIAEIASAHNGSSKSLMELAISAAENGADFVKLQIFETQALAHQTSPIFSALQRVEIPKETWASVISSLASRGIQLIAECYDPQSLKFALETTNFSGYKIPFSDIDDYEIILKYAAIPALVFAGIGGATRDELENFLSTCRSHSCSPILVYGYQNFPTRLSDLRLDVIRELKSVYACELAYADHTDANNYDETIAVCSSALAMGATYLEKHITLSRSLRAPDYHSSLEMEEFMKFSECLRGTYLALNQSEGSRLPLGDAELEYRKLMGKVAFATTNIPEGKIFDRTDVIFLRGDGRGMTRSDLLKKYGVARFKTNVSAGQLIDDRHF